MLSRKYYQLIADAIKDTGALHTDPAAQDALRSLSRNLVWRFKADNPNFAPERFREAAGVTYHTGEFHNRTPEPSGEHRGSRR